MQPHIAIIDYGMGNIRSVRNAFVKLGCTVTLTESAADLQQADALVLPGVGAFGEAMANLNRLDMVQPILDAVRNRKMPLLGICLGMQLLAERSEERGDTVGLGLIPGTVRPIPATPGLRLPHMGWNTLTIKKPEPLFSAARAGDSFYFVHSFHFDCDPSHVAATTEYGTEVVAAVQHEHLLGVQFHPERSQGSGLRLLASFRNQVRSTMHEGVC